MELGSIKGPVEAGGGCGKGLKTIRAQTAGKGPKGSKVPGWRGMSHQPLGLKGQGRRSHSDDSPSRVGTGWETLQQRFSAFLMV